MYDRVERTRWPVRAILPGALEVQRSDSGPPRLVGHFAVFNVWTEIRSVFEGDFCERIAPGAFKKTFKEQRNRIKVLFQHGRDPVVGDKPLGSIEKLVEDQVGAAYEVRLLDTEYIRELLPGLEAGVYGASFRFRPLKVEVNEDAQASDYNPSGLPECVVTECSVSEFGPVTFPAYAAATAGVRSLTDELAFGSLSHSNRLDELASFTEALEARFLPPNASGPRAPSARPGRLWGLETDADKLPDWYHRRNAELRQQGNRYGRIEPA